MTRPGLHKLQCEVCGAERELEAGIRVSYCCAQPMVEVEEEAPQAEGPTLKLKPRQ